MQMMSLIRLSLRRRRRSKRKMRKEGEKGTSKKGRRDMFGPPKADDWKKI